MGVRKKKRSALKIDPLSRKDRGGCLLGLCRYDHYRYHLPVSPNELSRNSYILTQITLQESVRIIDGVRKGVLKKDRSALKINPSS